MDIIKQLTLYSNGIPTDVLVEELGKTIEVYKITKKEEDLRRLEAFCLSLILKRAGSVLGKGDNMKGVFDIFERIDKSRKLHDLDKRMNGN